MNTNLSPNPATSIIQVSSDEKIEMIHIYNYSGRLVLSSTEPTINIAELAPGVYHMNILTENGLINKRFAKE